MLTFGTGFAIGFSVGVVAMLIATAYLTLRDRRVER